MSLKKERKRILGLLDKWRVPLGLDNWYVTLTYTAEPMESHEAHSSAAQVLAQCSVDWPYLQATMKWNWLESSLISDETLEEAFVHECMHILVREMREWGDLDAMHHEERVCTELARAFLRVEKMRGQ